MTALVFAGPSFAQTSAIAWCWNNYGQCNVPAGQTFVQGDGVGDNADCASVHSFGPFGAPKRAKGLEPSTFSLEGCDTPKPSGESAQLTEGVHARAAHTTAVDAHLEALLAAWPQLSEEMRAAVRAMVEATCSSP